MAEVCRNWLPRCVRTREVGARIVQAAHEAGILREQAPPPLDDRTGVDAVVVPTENELT